MKVDNLKFLESRMRKISRTEGVAADSCRSCMHDIKLLARNTKIHEQIYLLMAGKGLNHLSPSQGYISLVQSISNMEGSNVPFQL